MVALWSADLQQEELKGSRFFSLKSVLLIIMSTFLSNL